jgi:hypothetical protein
LRSLISFLARDDLLLPAVRRHLGQPVVAVVGEQPVDVGDVPHDLVVVRAPAQRHQGTRDDVGEAPGELLERRRVALIRQLVGDARGHLGDARERPDRVVARRDLRMPQVEHVELVLATGALALGVHAPQQVGIALGIEHDDHVAAADVLGDQDLGQPRLAHAGGPEDQGMPDPLTQAHPHRRLVGFDTVQRWLAAHRRQWRQGIPPGACTE